MAHDRLKELLATKKSPGPEAVFANSIFANRKVTQKKEKWDSENYKWTRQQNKQRMRLQKQSSAWDSWKFMRQQETCEWDSK